MITRHDRVWETAFVPEIDRIERGWCKTHQEFTPGTLVKPLWDDSWQTPVGIVVSLTENNNVVHVFWPDSTTEIDWKVVRATKQLWLLQCATKGTSGVK